MEVRLFIYIMLKYNACIEMQAKLRKEKPPETYVRGRLRIRNS